MGKNSNVGLGKAKSGKNDEFYTNYQDIEDEVSCYRDFLRGKTVLCPCDNPYRSNFFRFFVRSFNELGIRRLVTSCYSATPVKDLFSVTGADSDSGVEDDSEAERLRVHSDGALTAVVTRVDDDVLPGLLSGWSRSETDRILSLPGNSVSLLKGDGDFRSEEVRSIMRSCDVVVTNPPFSLFRDFFDVLTDLEKDFLIVGHINAVGYKNIFPHIRDRTTRLGETIRSGDRKFIVPDSYPLDASTCGVDDDGNKFINVPGVRWFTNLPLDCPSSKHVDLTSSFKEAPELYSFYDNFHALNIDKTSLIPYDYDGVMGVPITFLDKWDPEQFTLVAMSGLQDDFLNALKKDPEKSKNGAIVNGKEVYKRVFVNPVSKSNDPSKTSSKGK